jgi:hypothetical protein
MVCETFHFVSQLSGFNVTFRYSNNRYAPPARELLGIELVQVKYKTTP